MNFMMNFLMRKWYVTLLVLAFSSSGLAIATIAQPELPISALYKTEKSGANPAHAHHTIYHQCIKLLV